MNIFKKNKKHILRPFRKKSKTKQNNDDKNDFIYHHFIYLDLKFLESFIAQKYKGFPENFQTESVNESVKSDTGKQFTAGAEVEGKAGINSSNSLGAKVNAKIDGDRHNTSITEAKKSVISTTQHDNMYHDFKYYINYNKMICDKRNAHVGEYVELNDKFYYIDFDRLKKLYSKPFEAIHSKEKFDVIKNKIDLLSELIPFDALLYSSNFIILIDKDCLKDKKEHIGYTFDGKINVLGRVGKFIETDNESDKPELIKTLDQIQKYAISLLNELGFIKAEKAYLVNPIAIYY